MCSRPKSPTLTTAPVAAPVVTPEPMASPEATGTNDTTGATRAKGKRNLRIDLAGADGGVGLNA